MKSYWRLVHAKNEKISQHEINELDTYKSQLFQLVLVGYLADCIGQTSRDGADACTNSPSSTEVNAIDDIVVVHSETFENVSIVKSQEKLSCGSEEFQRPLVTRRESTVDSSADYPNVVQGLIHLEDGSPMNSDMSSSPDSPLRGSSPDHLEVNDLLDSTPGSPFRGFSPVPSEEAALETSLVLSPTGMQYDRLYKNHTPFLEQGNDLSQL
ncbi:uncharacterized protein LOC111045434 isoform X4 [Nilaparvata lugens]|uniref:uncharacterized protein LOC111045434 isoform X4 n=1 Tax=Nilaparvata lugens TaxID=108931 RepID=UPI00193EBDC7|nr:uncharacterized protein LOC111045434 isoform X4 [Nilaparvata lugens]